ncbi:ABC transporter permease [Azohydromonas sediminis]|uniref:ABC transporter permease n=1 Tax=Azohydromonas sediminis TaxID=2259674 RepID=UPI000E65A29B|nr:ABC transporter permease subunit [Azohydromonas sediminis]
MTGAVWTVWRKELLDAWRDRRTLWTVLASAVAVGPLALVLLSTLVADLEARAQAREVWAVGLGHAPTLRNFLERQTWTVHDAPASYEPALREQRLAHPVLVVGDDFEDALAHGRAPVVEVVSASGNARAEAGAAQLLQLLAGFNQEQATLRLAVRGVPASMLEAVRVQPRDVAEPGQRAAQLTAMLPFFVLLAVLYGALNAALDTTAGERERGSLEPLLANPVPPLSLVVGKWAAVTTVAVVLALLAAFGFLPGQWLLASDALAALLRYGAGEALRFVALLVPLAAAASALMMAVAIRSRSVKEAQASTTLVVLAISLLPLVTLFGQRGEQPWHLWVPGLAHSVLMTRVLRGQALAAPDVLLPAAVCVALTGVALASVARALRGGSALR